MDSMKRPRELPIDLRNRSFTLVEAGNDVTRSRLQHPGLLTPSRGIRVPWGVAQEFDAIIAPILACTPGAVACWGTAARLWNLPLPSHVQSGLNIHLATPKGANRPRRFGVTGHRLDLQAQDVHLLRGLAVTSPARTWLDLAGRLATPDLVAVGDAIVCSHQRSFGPNAPALGSVSDLRQVLDQHSGARGIRSARAALDLIRIGSDSVPETLLRLALVEAGLPEPELNVVIVSGSGRDVAWPDLAYREYRVSIQYDGAHHLSAEQQGSDARRDNESALAGWTSLRITKAQIQELGYAGVARQIRNVLRQRGWNPG